MEYRPFAIFIPDDEESSLEQGHSRHLRASRPDYSYQGWRDTMDDAAASDYAASDVTASPPVVAKNLCTISMFQLYIYSRELPTELIIM